ncbi:hypothetical protein VTL71DRAFT_16157 [Oculimacula yallundae]|uniref:Heterokaryon incompatibility domain-containing protein n=1 Tax=Oculimacula yallundae TaxID=86028 RepID=A0ABR4CFW5_9HELO
MAPSEMLHEPLDESSRDIQVHRVLPDSNLATSKSLYEPLDKNSRTIRLLRILPDSNPTDGRLQCKLVTRSLNLDFTYRALSYTWGEPDTFNFKIWINDFIVPVRQNLLCALRVLKEKCYSEHSDPLYEFESFSAKRPLIWIDALCINQSDLVERGHQVDMMGDIYRDAFEVFSWLGTPDLLELQDPLLDSKTEPPTEVEVPAFEALKLSKDVTWRYARENAEIERVYNSETATRNRQKIAANPLASDLSIIAINSRDVRKGKSSMLEQTEWGYEDFGDYLARLRNGAPRNDQSREWKRLSQIPKGDCLERFAQMCYNDYWSRLWIVQEVCLAFRLTLIYGRRQKKWTELCRFCKTIERMSRQPDGVELGNLPREMIQILESQPWKIMQIINKGVGSQDYLSLNGIHHFGMDRFLGTTLERALQLAVDSNSHERKDKIFGLLGLAEDVDSGEIIVDYSMSLFALYSTVMHFKAGEEDRNSKLGATVDMNSLSTVEFSQLLQKALLGPALTDEGCAELWHGRVNYDIDRDMHRVNMTEEYWVPGTGIAEVTDVGRSFPLMASFIEASLRALWDSDKHVFQLFGPRTVAEHDLSLFGTGSQMIGIAHTEVRAGDVLWTSLTGNNKFAMVRKVGRRFEMVGRAYFPENLRGIWANVFPIQPLSQQRIWEEKPITLTLSIMGLQVLTCPLRAERDESFYHKSSAEMRD